MAFTFFAPVFLSVGESVQVSCYDGHFKYYETQVDYGKRAQSNLYIYCAEGGP
jgi:hypothetical protein